MSQLCTDNPARERRPSEVPLFTNPFSSLTVPAPVVCQQPLPVPPMDVNWRACPLVLRLTSPKSELPPPVNYLNYIWMLTIFDRGNALDGKTEEQHDHIRVLSEIYQGTDITIDRVPDILDKTHSLTPDVIAESINRLFADLTINISTLQYRLVLELATIATTEECWSFRNREVDHYSKAKVRDSPSEDTAATAGLTVGEKYSDVTVKVKEVMPDPWSTELLEFVADNGYSKKRDACFSEAAKFLSETTSFATSAFMWRSFLDAAAWNKADHSLHNAINTTTPIPPATFHPIIVNGMLQLYLAGHAPVPLAHPLYQYTCYDCRYFGHWSCRNGRGSRWTPATSIPSKDENSGSVTPCPSNRVAHLVLTVCR
ncbi:hypothetical protein PISMIDRAFT_11391 [Pisolithus microcarpus 441]|uniref:Uncharacterized protein n=1 Tax=Pisolithus microcarpus 441 TaxID=765257 RepID=A0A0C9ZK58_9AGAM|nr:hypothetical protein PISMIDRAFT_11391 [Pisolithus microcarpus 441]